MSDAAALVGRSALAGRIYFVVFWEMTDKPGDRQAAHNAHIAGVRALEKDGRVLGAGPFLGEDNRPNGGGMFILRVGSRAEAQAIVDDDAYVRAGFRTGRIVPWRRSEGTFSLRVNIAEGAVTLD
jgi:uncharacterized protein YciI